MSVLKECIPVVITRSVWMNSETLLACARLAILVTHIKDALVMLSS